MKKLLLFALLALPVGALAQTQVNRATLISQYDLDGEAADDNQVIAATALVDNGTSVAGANWTILAQPDTCRLLDITVVDTDLSVGTLTVAGTGCLGEPKSCAFAFTAGDDTGVKTLTCADGDGAYFANVATVTTGAMTGESTETFTLGYTSNSVNGWPMYGRINAVGGQGERGVDALASFDVPYRITTSGVLSTTVTDVTGTDDAFANVSAGDLLIVNIGGTSYERKVTARASADSITISSPGLNIPAAGTAFKFKKLYFSTNPKQLLAVPVNGYKTALFDWSVEANANTGGVVMLLECTQERVQFPTALWTQIVTTTVASAATLASTGESIDLTLLPYTFCRMGFSFGTSDDADAADEKINATVTLLK